MNIFVTSPDPEKSAQFLDDKRVVKMVLETAQLLSTTLHCYNLDAPYKSTHINHPCARWVRQSRSNYTWTVAHFIALLQEYTKRYGKIHKCDMYTSRFVANIKNIPEGDLTIFVNCAANKSKGISFQHLTDTFMAYKLYLTDRWKYDKRVPTRYGMSLLK